MKEELDALHKETVRLLLQRIKDGTATAADLAVARNLLRDNGIQCLPEANPDLPALHQALPFEVKTSVGY